MKCINFKSPRKWTWPINMLLFNCCKLIPGRDKNIWVFGAWEGKKYDDNSRFLFEFINKNYKNQIRAVWLTLEQKTVNEITKLGYEAYSINSKEGKKIALQAGVAIYTNGLIDFGKFPLVGGALIVSLWHGMALKKIYNDTYHGTSLFLKKTLDIFFSWTYRNVTISTSEYTKQQQISVFNIKDPHSIYITGQPRNDIFKEYLSKEDIFKKVKINYNKKLVLYMPTYRGELLGSKAMENIITELYYDKNLEEALTKSESIFIAKLHPLTPHIPLTNRDNFIILDNNSVESNQKLLAIADTLISDYSSCSIDYALLNRPIIFYLPDKKEFIEKSEPLYDEFFDICKENECTTPQQLANAITNSSLKGSEALNKYFNHQSTINTCYSYNVYKVISAILNKSK